MSKSSSAQWIDVGPVAHLSAHAPHHVLQRQCACGQHSGKGECESCHEKRKDMLQRAAINSSPVHEAPPIVHEVLRSPGQLLDPATRAFMEPHFGHDFSHVRLHTDAKAADSARAVNARAYTVGRNVVFSDGQYAPSTNNGRSLIAHELTHVVQQARGGVSADAESRAEVAAQRVIRGESITTGMAGGSMISLQKAGLDDPTATPAGAPTNLPAEISGHLAPYMRQTLNEKPVLSEVLLILHARVGKFWRHLKEITWVGENGEMEFSPVDENDLKKDLEKAGYASSYIAASGDNRWGLREPNVETAGLHWRGMPAGIVNVHIDLHPPGGTGLWHLIQDLWRRKETHTPEKLREGVEKLRTNIPALKQVVTQPPPQTIPPSKVKEITQKPPESKPEGLEGTIKVGGEIETSGKTTTGSSTFETEIGRKGFSGGFSIAGKQSSEESSSEFAVQAKIPLLPEKMKEKIAPLVLMKEIGFTGSLELKRSNVAIASELTAPLIGFEWEKIKDRLDLELHLLALGKIGGEQEGGAWKPSYELGGELKGETKYRPTGGPFFVYVEGSVKFTTTKEGGGEFKPGVFTFSGGAGAGFKF